MQPTQMPPAQPQPMPAMQPVKQKSAGPVIGIIIILIVLIIGALYFWGARLNRETVPQESAPLSSSDAIEDISADLNATVVNDIDSDLNAMANELQ